MSFHQITEWHLTAYREGLASQLFFFFFIYAYLKILSRANSLIANNNTRSVILEIKNDRCKIIKILIFRSLSREHF